MKILIVPDSFKGTLSAQAICRIATEEIKRHWPQASVTSLPFSDGGEGAIDLFSKHVPGQVVETSTVDALQRPITASYFRFSHEPTAWIELSQTAGLAHLTLSERNPMNTTTYGVGIQIKHALDNGCKKIILGLGGSATNDAGMGIFQALGGILYDQDGNHIRPTAQNLGKLHRVETKTFDSYWLSAQLVLAVDVDNPLLGSNGATQIYAKQKGATSEQLVELENYLIGVAEVIEQHKKISIRDIKGGGAAGGTAAGLAGLTKGQVVSAYDLISDMVQLDDYIEQADLIITGEGCVDAQTNFGKLPMKIAQRAKYFNRPVICLAGGIKGSPEELFNRGMTAVFPIVQEPVPLEQALEMAEPWLVQTIGNVVRFCKALKNV